MRSPMSSLSTGTSSSTPSISRVDEPAPMMCAPMRLRNAHRSVISGSRAAFSMTLVPLARTAAVIRFSVAPTLGNSSTMRLPESPAGARASIAPCTTSISAPIASKPPRCMLILRLPMLSPPGIATRASPQRARSGPSTLIDARMRETISYGASGSSSPLASIESESGPVHFTRAPRTPNNSIITSRSATGGMFAMVVRPGASSAAAICFNPAFFVAPGTRTDPSSRGPGRTRKRVMTDERTYGSALSPVARPPRWSRRRPPAPTRSRC